MNNFEQNMESIVRNEDMEINNENKPVTDKEENVMNKEKEEHEIKKVALVTTTQIDLGIKSLSGALSIAGFETGKFNLLKEADGGYTEDEINQMLEYFRDYDIVGISTTDYHFSDRVVPLVQAIKERLKKPVILGGVHAMLCPDECLSAGADAVCLGEGESGLIDLLKNWDKRLEQKNRNFVVSEADLKNIDALRAIPLHEIDQYSPDFSYNNYFSLQDGHLVQLSHDNLQDLKHHQIGHKNTIIYASDRGCPQKCTFCYNVNIDQKFEEAREEQNEVKFSYLRRKSVDKIIEELQDLKKENPWVEFLNLMNDDTAARTTEELERFADLYKEKIDWPFYCMVSPQSLKGGKGKRKIAALIRAGMKELNMGIQTNGKTNNEIYGRPQNDNDIIELSKTISEFCRKDASVDESGKIDAFYDFIIHNPFENESDIKRTIDLIKNLSTPFDIASHTLFLGRSTILRQIYEDRKKEATNQGENIDRVVDDNVGESDLHDTYKFIKWLKPNKTFVINTLCEFMAGRHDENMVGRIPRFAKDLVDFDVFRKFTQDHQDFRDIIVNANISEYVLSIDLLTSDQVLKYFNTNKDGFEKLLIDMNDVHPIRYTNQVDNV